MSEDKSPYAVSETARTPEMPPAVPSKTAKVFGVIHICYAVLAIFSVVLSLGLLILFRTFFESLQVEMKELESIMNAMDGFIGHFYIGIIVQAVFAIMLLVAGIGLLKRKLWAQKLSIFWAVTRVIALIVVPIFSASASSELYDEINKAGEVSGQEMEGFVTMSQGIGLIMGVITYSIYPVLTIIFLMKRNVKNSLR